MTVRERDVNDDGSGDWSETFDEPDILHGVNCPKAVHADGRDGYLHGPDDDRPYDVDGVMYCGRCHVWLDPKNRDQVVA